MNQLFNQMIRDGASAILAKAHGDQVIDVGPNRLTGTIHNGGCGVAGLTGLPWTESLALNGVGQYAVVEDPNNHLDVVDPYTVVFWLNAQDDKRDQDLFEFGNSTNGFRIGLDDWDDATRNVTLRYAVGGVNANKRTSTSSPLFVYGQTHMVACVLDSGSATIYVDGVSSAGSGGGQAISTSAPNNLYIGRRKQGSGWNFLAAQALPFVAYPNTALTVAQLNEYMRIADITRLDHWAMRLRGAA